jgi:hypothetical protein
MIVLFSINPEADADVQAFQTNASADIRLKTAAAFLPQSRLARKGLRDDAGRPAGM